MVFRRRRLPAAFKAAAAFALFVLAASAHVAFASVPVFVNGRQVVVHPGATIEEAAAARLRSHRGDLVAARDGRVLIAGGGAEPTVERNGLAAQRDEVLRPGDELRLVRGRDVVEPTIERIEAIPIPTRIEGTGALLTLASPGSPGIRRIVCGSVSGDVVSSETVRPAQPMVLKRMIDGRRKKVALTFDDGPWPRQTDAVLDVLRREGVSATFFVIGRQVAAHPEIVRRIVRAGHALGNHTYNHVDLAATDGSRLVSEIEGTSRAIRSACGVTPRWLRPPGGSIDADAYEAASKQRLRVALWTVDPQDWRKVKTAAQIEAEVVRAVRPGAVILLHDGGGDRSATIAALPGIIRKLRARGYEFVPLADLGPVKSSW